MQKSVILLYVWVVVLASLVLGPNSVKCAPPNPELRSLLDELSQEHLQQFQSVSKILTADQIIAIADSNKDGLLSLQEVSDYLAKYGVKLTVDQLRTFDMDNDGYFSKEEIETIKNLH